MDPRTVELLRALQGQEHDAAAFERIREMFNDERTTLKAEDDLGMLSHLGELLEGWSEGAEPELGTQALALAARSAEDDLEQPERAIKLLERVLDLEPTTEALQQLADLYMKRGGENDREQAADLYAALGETLGGADGKPYLERAIALVPGHEASIELSRMYASEGKYRDALVCISPLAERGNADAGLMREAYLANLEGAVPPKKSKRGESLPPPQVQRPARSGGTMVGFRLDQYHEALRQEKEQLATEVEPGAKQDAAEGGDGPGEDSAVRALPQRPEAEQAALPVAPAAAPASVAKKSLDASKTMIGVGMPLGKPVPARLPPAPAPAAAAAPIATATFSVPLASKIDQSKTMMGLGMPAGLLQSSPAPAAEPVAPPEVAPEPVAAAPVEAPEPAKYETKKTMMGVGVPAGLPVALQNGMRENGAPESAMLENSAPVDAPAPVVRRSLPPPNPALVRASKPVSSRPPAPALGAPEPVAAAPVATPAPLEPFTVSATPRDDDFLPKKKAGPPMKTIAIAAAVLLVLGGGVFAMMGGDSEPDASAADSARVSQQLASSSAAPAAAVAPAPAPAPAPAAAPTPPPAPVPAAAPTPPPEPVAEKKPERKKPSGNVKIAPKEIKVRGGKITGTQIMVALEDALPKIESCYNEALEDKPRLSGKVTLGFNIQKTGKLAGAKVSKSTIKNKPFESCAIEALEGQRFPKVKKVATVTMPIGLTP
jgi:hypothetical protein